MILLKVGIIGVVDKDKLLRLLVVSSSAKAKRNQSHLWREAYEE
jgi:hypothetical protein